MGNVVMTTAENGDTLEPWEMIGIDVDNEDSGSVLERMATRNSNLVDMATVGNRTRLRFECATRSFLGMRSWLRDATGGTAVITSELIEPRAASAPTAKDRNGVIVANSNGIATSVDLAKAAKFGKIFIAEGTEVYTGMIVGEHNKTGDHNTSVARKHDGYAAAGNMAPPVVMTLEQCLAYLAADEKLEVTPKRLNLRKEFLCPNERKLIERKAGKM